MSGTANFRMERAGAPLVMLSVCCKGVAFMSVNVFVALCRSSLSPSCHVLQTYGRSLNNGSFEQEKCFSSLRPALESGLSSPMLTGKAADPSKVFSEAAMRWKQGVPEGYRIAKAGTDLPVLFFCPQ